MCANLKSLLETGHVLPRAPWEMHNELRAAQMARNDPRPLKILSQDGSAGSFSKTATWARAVGGEGGLVPSGPAAGSLNLVILAMRSSSEGHT